MERLPGVMWAGSFNENLYRLITVFALMIPSLSHASPALIRKAAFTGDTVETLCNALIRAEDAVICVDVAGTMSYQPTSILTESEKEQMFSEVHSPYHGPLVGLANIVQDYLANPTAFNSDNHIFQPLKKYWSQIMRYLWDNPSRSLRSDDIFREDRYLVSFIFCRIVEVERPFGSVIHDESDLTISLLSRYWAHETGMKEIVQLLVFYLILIPRRRLPGSSPSEDLPLIIVGEDEVDYTLPVLRRILQSNEFIAEFIQGTASHLRRFRDFEATGVATVLEKLGNWAHAFKEDPLCSEFINVIRTSASLWSGLFEASSRSTNKRTTASFKNTPHHYMSALASHLSRSRGTPDEARALSALWVSNGVFDAVEMAVLEALRHGTEDELVIFSGYIADIVIAVSYGPDHDPSFLSLLRQQLPRPLTIRRLWDLSSKLSGLGIIKMAPSHAARMTMTVLDGCYSFPNVCSRRGCDNGSTARCVHCKSGYCSRDCQKLDWKDHKLVCNVDMTMSPALRDEAFKLIAGPEEMARARIEEAARALMRPF